MQISDKGLAFIARHEGLVTRAYRDPAGVLTIGYGFTMRSRVFAGWWRAKHGRGLGPNDRIDRADADALLRRLVDDEYGAAVRRLLPGLLQHQFDAACSVAYNLGPRALKWRWAQALKSGDVDIAAEILSSNYNTAGGRRLSGLARRRKDEARLLLVADYGDGQGAAGPGADRSGASEDADLLRELGYSTADMGAAVSRFQRDHPPLVVDGIMGPATRATMRRLLSRRRAEKGGAGGVAGAGAVGVLANEAAGIDWTTIALGLGTAGAMAVLAYVAWVNRGRIWLSVPAWLRDRLGRALGLAP